MTLTAADSSYRISVCTKSSEPANATRRSGFWKFVNRYITYREKIICLKNSVTKKSEEYKENTKLVFCLKNESDSFRATLAKLREEYLGDAQLEELRSKCVVLERKRNVLKENIEKLEDFANSANRIKRNSQRNRRKSLASAIAEDGAEELRIKDRLRHKNKLSTFSGAISSKLRANKIKIENSTNSAKQRKSLAASLKKLEVESGGVAEQLLARIQEKDKTGKAKQFQEAALKAEKTEVNAITKIGDAKIYLAKYNAEIKEKEKEIRRNEALKLKINEKQETLLRVDRLKVKHQEKANNSKIDINKNLKKLSKLTWIRRRLLSFFFSANHYVNLSLQRKELEEINSYQPTEQDYKEWRADQFKKIRAKEVEQWSQY